jgi:hypothetical protein
VNSKSQESTSASVLPLRGTSTTNTCSEMTELDSAINALKAAVKQGGIDKRVGDVVNQFTSYLVLLVRYCTLVQNRY